MAKQQRILFQVKHHQGNCSPLSMEVLGREISIPYHSKVIEAILEYSRIMWDMNQQQATHGGHRLNVAWESDYIYTYQHNGNIQDLMGNFQDRLDLQCQDGDMIEPWLSECREKVIVYFITDEPDCFPNPQHIESLAQKYQLHITFKCLLIQDIVGKPPMEIYRSQTLNMEAFFFNLGNLRNGLFQFVMSDLNLISISIKGIPMKNRGQPSSNYSVNLLCRANQFDLTGIMTDQRNQILHFQWIRNDPGSNIQNQFLIRDSYPLTPASPEQKTSRSLMSFISKHRSATIGLIRPNQPVSITHMILQHGNQSYIKCLRPSEMYIPILHLQKEKINYRESQFMSLIQQNNLITLTSNSTSKTIEDLKKQKMTLVSNNQCPPYYTVKEIERLTRAFPLEHVEGSYIFKDTLQGPVHHFFGQLSGYVMTKHELAPVELGRVAKMLQELYHHVSTNDPGFLPQYQGNHTERYHAYRSIWGDVRDFIRDHKNQQVLRIMDDLFPNYFYEPEQTDSKKAKFKDPRIPRDRYGKPIFPIVLGALKIHSLGVVDFQRENYHTEKYIWPIGYKASRTYSSVNDVSRRITYTCEIREGGDQPSWVLHNPEDPDNPICEKSATAAWTVIVKQVNEIKTSNAGKRVYTNVSGPEYYGLAHRTIQRLISELPNSEKVFRPCATFPAVRQRKTKNLDSRYSNHSANGSFNEIFNQHQHQDPRHFPNHPAAGKHSSSTKWQQQQQQHYERKMQEKLIQRNEQMHKKNQRIEQKVKGMKWTQSKSTVPIGNFVQQQKSLYDFHSTAQKLYCQDREPLPGQSKQLYSNMYVVLE